VTYGDLQSNVVALLNRRDCSSALTTMFIQQAIQKIQRSLRVPAMEKSIVATVGSLFTDGLQVPGDLLQLIAITDEDCGLELKRGTLPQALALQKNAAPTGRPQLFTRRGAKFLIAPIPAQGKNIRMDYYAQFKPLVNLADTNVLTDIAPDLLLQGALVFACTHFNDKRKDGFTADYNATIDDINMQAARDELTGNAQIAPALHFDDEDY
jgi:hypothetical protein